MNIKDTIQHYIDSQPELKRRELQVLNDLIVNLMPDSTLWFLDGKNEDGKVVSNPNIGYGTRPIRYADGSTKDFYRIGLSANTTGISVYIMGMADKTFLAREFGEKIGKAGITGYCIKFRKLSDIDTSVLEAAINCGFADDPDE